MILREPFSNYYKPLLFFRPIWFVHLTEFQAKKGKENPTPSSHPHITKAFSVSSPPSPLHLHNLAHCSLKNLITIQSLDTQMADRDDEKRWHEKKLKDMWPARYLTLVGFLNGLAVAIIAINIESPWLFSIATILGLACHFKIDPDFIQSRLQIRRPHYLRSRSPSPQSRWN